jgi:hypothetical protein
MVSIGGPANDRFQVIAEHDAENFAYRPKPPRDRSQRRSNDRAEKATVQVDRRRLAKAAGIRIKDVFVTLADLSAKTGRSGWASPNKGPDVLFRIRCNGFSRHFTRGEGHERSNLYPVASGSTAAS